MAGCRRRQTRAGGSELASTMGPPLRPLGQETPIRRSLTIIIALIALAAVAVPALAAGGSVDVPRKFKTLIPKVSSKSGIPVLLPSRVYSYVAPSRVFGSGSATRKSYDLELGVTRQCNGANACFVAAFLATRGGKPAFRTKVSLIRGITGYFKPVTCGASCSPAFVQWVQGGVLYEIEYKGASQSKEKSTMVALANSAIRHGKR